jgi:hypothetical protein
MEFGDGAGLASWNHANVIGTSTSTVAFSGGALLPAPVSNHHALTPPILFGINRVAFLRRP